MLGRSGQGVRWLITVLRVLLVVQGRGIAGTFALPSTSASSCLMPSLFLPLRLRGGQGADARRRDRDGGEAVGGSLDTESGITGMVSTMFFSSPGGPDSEMELPQVLSPLLPTVVPATLLLAWIARRSCTALYTESNAARPGCSIHTFTGITLL